MSTMEKISSQELPTPMISSSSVKARHSDSSRLFREFLKARALSMTTNDYVKQQVDRQVKELFKNAMDRFYYLHGRSLNRLEKLLVEDLVPRLDSSRADHDHFVRHMKRLLKKVRPMMTNFKAYLEERPSFCANLPDELELRCKRFRKEQDKRFSRSSIMSFDSSLRPSLLNCKKAQPVLEDPASQSVAEPQPTPPLTVNKSEAHLQPKVDITQPAPAPAKKNVETIYQNFSFVSSPKSKVKGPPLFNMSKAMEKHFGPMPKVKKRSPESAHKLREINRRLLQTNLLYKKSSYSLYLNRFKFPPPWPLPQPTLSKVAMLAKSPLYWKYH